jgi:phosphatidylinositol 3-kinase
MLIPPQFKLSTMRKGKHKLYVWPGEEADGKTETCTPSKLKKYDELDRLEKLVKKHDTGDIQPVEWLDSLAFRQIEKIHKVNPHCLFLYGVGNTDELNCLDLK